MPSDWNEDALRHKYDPLPDEPRYRKKARKRHVRSDHRHDYEKVCMRVRMRVGCLYYVGTRCNVCGRVGDMTVLPNAKDPIAGLSLYEVKDMRTRWKTKELGEEMRAR